MDDLLGCEHKNRSFVKGGSGMGNRYSVHICERCGEVMVWAMQEGVQFSLNFHVHDPLQLDMMRKWTDYVLEDEAQS